jgi:hypothetical protein
MCILPHPYSIMQQKLIPSKIYLYIYVKEKAKLSSSYKQMLSLA